MAVPKKKRSASVVSIRRSNYIYKLLNKYFITKRTSSQCIMNLSNQRDPFPINSCYYYIKNCGYNFNSKSKNVCSGCYSLHFRKVFTKYINK